MSLDQSLAEELNQITYPLEDSNVVKILLTKFRLRANMLSQERIDIDAKIAKATAMLEQAQKREDDLRKEHGDQRKLEQEARELTDFVRSFAEAKAVTVDGREIIADIWRTRAEEDEYYETLKSQLEDLKDEEAKLTAQIHARYQRYTELSAPFMEFLRQEYGMDLPRDAQDSRDSRQGSAIPGTPKHLERDDKAEDVEMDVS